LAHGLPTAPDEADDEGVGTAIVVTLLVLLAVGIVTDQLLRLRRWLKKPPNSRT
jgi:cytochrome b